MPVLLWFKKDREIVISKRKIRMERLGPGIGLNNFFFFPARCPKLYWM